MSRAFDGDGLQANMFRTEREKKYLEALRGSDRLPLAKTFICKLQNDRFALACAVGLLQTEHAGFNVGSKHQLANISQGIGQAYVMSTYADNNGIVSEKTQKTDLYKSATEIVAAHDDFIARRRRTFAKCKPAHQPSSGLWGNLQRDLSNRSG